MSVFIFFFILCREEEWGVGGGGVILGIIVSIVTSSESHTQGWTGLNVTFTADVYLPLLSP